MAAILTLRKYGKVLAILIGLALALFIIGDMLQSGQAVLGQRKLYIAEVGGKPILFPEYEQAMDDAIFYYKKIYGVAGIDEQTMLSIRVQVWDQLINEKLLEIIQENTGITVTPEELSDMVFGANPAPIVRQLFVNPQTGQYDPNFARQVLMNLDKDPELKRFWIYIEKNLKLQRLSEKYANLISKAIFATNFDAKVNYFERNKIFDLLIAPYYYKDIPDDQIQISEADIKKYYEKHKEQFYQTQETRRILYVVFQVVPTKEDTTRIYQQIEAYKPQFEQTDDPVDFVNAHSDVPFQDKYYTKSELPKPLDSIMFAVDTGFVYGPYYDNGYFALARLLDRQVRPDTVDFRHILINPADPRFNGDIEKAREFADSLLNQIKQGADFEAMVREYSADQGSIQNGGKYENVVEGQMVPEINEFVFGGKKGDIDIVETRYGIHIVEILDQRSFEPKVKVAFLKLEIVPAQQTYDNVYREAALFRSACKKPEDFERIAQEKGLMPRVASNLTKGSYTIPGLPVGQTRQIINWAFNARKNEISNVFDLTDYYVVAKLVEIKPAGYVPVEDVYAYIKSQVLAQKKGEYILNLIKQQNIPTNDIEAFAKAVNSEVITATNVPFSAYTINKVGYEPVIFGAFDLLKVNQPFGPLAGKQAVYLIEATSITVPPEPTADQLLPTEQSLTYGWRSRIYTEVFEKLKRDYEIKDYRTRFF